MPEESNTNENEGFFSSDGSDPTPQNQKNIGDELEDGVSVTPLDPKKREPQQLSPEELEELEAGGTQPTPKKFGKKQKQPKYAPPTKNSSRSTTAFVLRGIVIISLLFTIFFIAILIIGTIFPDAVPIDTPKLSISELNGKDPEPEPEPEIIDFDPGPIPTFEEYTNPNYRFTFRYPDEANFTVNEQETPISFKVTYSRLDPEIEVTEDEDLGDGYIFKIFVYPEFTGDQINKLAADKRNAYRFSCPQDTVDVTNIRAANFKGNNAVTFSVDGCNGGYIETFINKENQVFELVQFYAGNVGFKQQHLGRTEEMKNAFEFLRTSQIEQDPEWIARTYRNIITFYHPSLEGCCSVLDSLPIEDPSTIQFATLGFEDEYGFTVFAARYTDNYDFFLEQLKTDLEQNFVLVNERYPSTEEVSIAIGNQPGIKLIGYAWWGDVYVANVPNRDWAVIVTTTEIIPTEYSDTFTQILRSFQFN